MKLHVRSSSGDCSNWKNMCRPSSLIVATYVPPTWAMWHMIAESLYESFGPGLDSGCGMG